MRALYSRMAGHLVNQLLGRIQQRLQLSCGLFRQPIRPMGAGWAGLCSPSQPRDVLQKSHDKGLLGRPIELRGAEWACLHSQAQPRDKDVASRTQVDESLSVEDFFGIDGLFTRTQLFEARVHLGHNEGLLDQRMKKYLIGKRREQCIIDLDQTVPLLRGALNFTAHIAYRKGIILFVNRTPQFSYAIEEMAGACGEYAHTRHWQRGCFTNAQIQMGPGTRLPDLLVFFNTLNDVLSQHQAVVDAAKMNIPSVGVVDSNCNPNLITYPVPGNDDTPSAMELYMKLFRQAVLLGKQKRKQLIDSPV